MNLNPNRWRDANQAHFRPESLPVATNVRLSPKRQEQILRMLERAVAFRREWLFPSALPMPSDRPAVEVPLVTRGGHLTGPAFDFSVMIPVRPGEDLDSVNRVYLRRYSSYSGSVGLIEIQLPSMHRAN